MRTLLTILITLMSLTIYGQEDYMIKLNDTLIEISLDKEYPISFDGVNIKFKVIAKDTLIYNDDLYCFKHSKDYKVTKMLISEGIEQIMLMTAEGSGILIQKYSTVNPTNLNEMLISEVTKESLNYGYKLERKDYKRELKSGQELEVDKAVLTYKDETNIYEVASLGDKDEGILIMTMIMNEKQSEKGKKIIDLMWNTLNYK